MTDKLKITWEEVNSAQVDEKLSRQSAVGRAQSHYGQMTAGQEAEPFHWSRLLYNSLCYMALFGLAGGLLAWIVGETIMAVTNDQREGFGLYAWQEEQLVEQFNRGEITKEQFDSQSAHLQRQFGGNPYVRVHNDASLSDAEKLEKLGELQSHDAPKALISIVLWFGLNGVILALFVSVADQVVSHNWRAAIINGSVAIALGLVGAWFGGVLAGIVYNLVRGDTNEISIVQIAARTMGWMIFGGFTAIAPGVVLKNWKRFLIGLAGGLIGGMFGGLMFDVIGMVTSSAVPSRFVALLAIGVVTGLGTGLIENAAKSGWLRVVAGLIAGKQFVLYKNPTYIGSSPQCEIYLFKDPAVNPRHAAIHKVPGGYVLEDLNSAGGTLVNNARVTRAALKNFDHIQIGSTVFVFQEKEQAGT
jgi:uncharacterized membrane protein YjfL (UPF0719 family)